MTEWQREGVPCMPGYVPLHRTPAVVEGITRNLRPIEGTLSQDWEPLHLPALERICCDEGVWLPQNVLLGDRRDIEDVVEAIAKIRSVSCAYPPA